MRNMTFERGMDMRKKYEFTGEVTVNDKGATLYRIKALIDIPLMGVRAGDKGGWIETEQNLSHLGNCWVSKEAQVFGRAYLAENALAGDNAQVFGYAAIIGNATVYGSAAVFDSAFVCDNAKISGTAKVMGKSRIRHMAKITHNAVVNNVLVKGMAHIGLNADLQQENEYITIGPIGSRDDFFTFYRGTDGEIYGACDRFSVSHEEFWKLAEKQRDDKDKAACQDAALYAIARLKQ